SLHLSAIYTPCDYCSYRTSTSFAVLSSHVASYMISVRQTRGLPRASFRFHITMDTLAFGYVLTATRSHSGLSPIRVRPCWANKRGTSISTSTSDNSYTNFDICTTFASNRPQTLIRQGRLNVLRTVEHDELI